MHARTPNEGHDEGQIHGARGSDPALRIESNAAPVMDGAEVGVMAIVTACALVLAGMRITQRSLDIGAPARVLRSLSDDAVARKREGTATYLVLRQRCVQTLQDVASLQEVQAGAGDCNCPACGP